MASAQQTVDQVKEKMTPEQIAEATRLAEEWAKAHPRRTKQ